MPTTVEDLTVDGVSLKTLAQNIETLAATLRMPAKKAPNSHGAGRNGTDWVAGRLFEESSLDLPMWVDGAADDGSIPTGNGRIQFYANIDRLTRLFGKTYGLLDVRHILPGGTVRQCFAEVRSVIDFTTAGTPPYAKFGVTLSIPGAFWQDVNTTTYASIMGTPLPQSLAVFPTATAPLEDLVITIRGPITNPTLTDPTTGATITITVTLLAGDLLVIDNGAMTVTKNGAGYLNTTPFPLSYHNIGSPDFISLTPPNTGGAAIITLSGSNGSTSGTNGTQLTVVGRAKYLVG